MRQVCGLDVHKDSVFACIINENGVVFQEKYVVLTPELEQLASKLQEYDVGEVCMESITIVAVKLYISEGGYAKLLIALARGKKEYDKRQSIKEKDLRREMDRM